MSRIHSPPRKRRGPPLWWVTGEIRGLGKIQHGIRAQTASDAWARYREIYTGRRVDLMGVVPHKPEPVE
jgi:hypothetical protein